eukprot:4201646-Pyramimonas_sp.AAC.1
MPRFDGDPAPPMTARPPAKSSGAGAVGSDPSSPPGSELCSKQALSKQAPSWTRCRDDAPHVEGNAT